MSLLAFFRVNAALKSSSFQKGVEGLLSGVRINEAIASQRKLNIVIRINDIPKATQLGVNGKLN